ncbi:hypothetical protein WK59_03910 [Burkholderia ubonensis]|uniref:hypothetical protein n=1 Tax=Burkholderia ubonensis TaxID=101571 RepID=UPI00075BF906|nr:hypothetical protein [Burkholderia ubonensis]KVT91890.1 hypothetical protein WK59_03910 [Burkholderia ubonensis]
MSNMTGWRVVRLNRERHVVPCGDLREHAAKGCTCNPTADDEDPGVIVHHAFDGREAFETGERKVS